MYNYLSYIVYRTYTYPMYNYTTYYILSTYATPHTSLVQLLILRQE